MPAFEIASIRRSMGVGCHVAPIRLTTRGGLHDSRSTMRPIDRPAPPLRAVRLRAQCPGCRKPAEEKYRPFCSKRCADVDLGRWLKESYRVPTDETPDDGGEQS
jgi:endogenous inhibitor of DNA gyrase (YacG/DUF329 family)